MTKNKRISGATYVLIAILFSAALPVKAASLSYSSNTNINLLTPSATLTIEEGSAADGVTIQNTDVVITLSAGETFVLTSPQLLSSVTTGSGGNNAEACASGIETDTIVQTTGSETYTLAPTGSACTESASPSSTRSNNGAAAITSITPPELSSQPLDFAIASQTGNIVTLSLNADPATVKGYAISTKADFSDSTGILPYASNPTYQLPDTAAHTIYLKYSLNTGSWSPVISHTIQGTTASAPTNANTTAPATAATTTTTTSSPPVIFSRTLKLGSKGNDVLALQKFLNAHGFVIAATGAGSPGQETTIFGNLTKAALIKFQNANASSILAPLGLTRGTGIFGTATIKAVNDDF